ncbi:uncharacterized protein DNG_06727 [Cephalotrichum gorgonifer]|uniref:Rab-GAP TBC domain-containing protein n=1 Tax=Cephalotrichum gorgonifer TaxID=2041049 RepID=A0AAE8N252_9PEZI|nr:uncharacterized protein DNG_06727 [Cephalotrichum gorgonifer]
MNAIRDARQARKERGQKNRQCNVFGLPTTAVPMPLSPSRVADFRFDSDAGTETDIIDRDGHADSPADGLLLPREAGRDESGSVTRRQGAIGNGQPWAPLPLPPPLLLPPTLPSTLEVTRPSTAGGLTQSSLRGPNAFTDDASRRPGTSDGKVNSNNSWFDNNNNNSTRLRLRSRTIGASTDDGTNTHTNNTQPPPTPKSRWPWARARAKSKPRVEKLPSPKLELEPEPEPELFFERPLPRTPEPAPQLPPPVTGAKWEEWEWEWEEWRSSSSAKFSFQKDAEGESLDLAAGGEGDSGVGFVGGGRVGGLFVPSAAGETPSASSCSTFPDFTTGTFPELTCASTAFPEFPASGSDSGSTWATTTSTASTSSTTASAGIDTATSLVSNPACGNCATTFPIPPETSYRASPAHPSTAPNLTTTTPVDTPVPTEPAAPAVVDTVCDVNHSPSPPPSPPPPPIPRRRSRGRTRARCPPREILPPVETDTTAQVLVNPEPVTGFATRVTINSISSAPTSITVTSRASSSPRRAGGATSNTSQKLENEDNSPQQQPPTTPTMQRFPDLSGSGTRRVMSREKISPIGSANFPSPSERSPTTPQRHHSPCPAPSSSKNNNTANINAITQQRNNSVGSTSTSNNHTDSSAPSDHHYNQWPLSTDPARSRPHAPGHPGEGLSNLFTRRARDRDPVSDTAAALGSTVPSPNTTTPPPTPPTTAATAERYYNSTIPFGRKPPAPESTNSPSTPTSTTNTRMLSSTATASPTHGRQPDPISSLDSGNYHHRMQSSGYHYRGEYQQPTLRPISNIKVAESPSSFRSQDTVSTTANATTITTERSSLITGRSSATSMDAGVLDDDDEPSVEDVMQMYEKGFYDDTDEELEAEEAALRGAQRPMSNSFYRYSLTTASAAAPPSPLASHPVAARAVSPLSPRSPLPPVPRGPPSLAPSSPTLPAHRLSPTSPGFPPYTVSPTSPTFPPHVHSPISHEFPSHTLSPTQHALPHHTPSPSSPTYRPRNDNDNALPIVDALPIHSSIPKDLPPVIRPVRRGSENRDSAKSMGDCEKESSDTLPSQAPPAPSVTPAVEPPEDPTSRDRYGFKKVNQYITREEYDAWDVAYTPYLERRHKKWAALMKESNLTTEHPNRFPPPSAKVKRFIRKGIPPEWRGAAWFYYAGGPAILGKHAGLYDRLVSQTASPADADIIERDLHRTFPDNYSFRPPGTSTASSGRQGPDPSETPMISALRRVLLAFSIYNPKIGYCQSLNFIAGLLLLFVPTEEQAFWLLNIVTRTLLPGTHETSLEGSKVDLGVLMTALRSSMPDLWRKLAGDGDEDALDTLSPASMTPQNQRPGTSRSNAPRHAIMRSRSRRARDAAPISAERLPPITITMAAWFMSCYIGTLPIETTLRVWDVFFYEGSKTLFRVALAVLKAGEDDIRAVDDPMEMFSVVQGLPRRMLDANELLGACFKRRNGFGHLSQGAVDGGRREMRERSERERDSAGSGGTVAGAGTEKRGGGLFGRRRRRDTDVV